MKIRGDPTGKMVEELRVGFRKRDKALTSDKRKIRKNTEGKLTVR